MAVFHRDHETDTAASGVAVRHRVDPTDDIEVREPQARGGVSPMAVVTGTFVAFGVMMLLSAVVAGLLDQFDVVDLRSGDLNVGNDSALRAGIGGALILVVAQFIAYLWGGYTAGRMARGAGATNGFLVALLAVLAAAAVGAVTAGLGVDPDWPYFGDTRLPVEDDTAIRFGIGTGIAVLITMFVAATIGGRSGERWHRKVEAEPRAYEYVEYEAE